MTLLSHCQDTSVSIHHDLANIALESQRTPCCHVLTLDSLEVMKLYVCYDGRRMFVSYFDRGLNIFFFLSANLFFLNTVSMFRVKAFVSNAFRSQR